MATIRRSGPHVLFADVHDFARNEPPVLKSVHLIGIKGNCCVAEATEHQHASAIVFTKPGAAMVQDMYDQLATSIEGESQELAANKVGREDLAKLLGELAGALKKDAKG